MMDTHGIMRHLQRPKVRENLEVRHRVKQEVRSFLATHNFIEVDTPLLCPRIDEYPGEPFRVISSDAEEFWLPESPQVYKEFLVGCGIDRYFQFARCFRQDRPDPAKRDRAREFIQIDLEMITASCEDIKQVAENLMTHICQQLGLTCDRPFKTLTARECIKAYGTDKPDLRNSLDELSFLWVVKFPLIEKYIGDRPIPSHHVFAKPDRDPRDIREANEIDAIDTESFDLVLNGVEIGGGDLRVTSRGIFEYLLDFFQFSPQQLRFFTDFLGNDIRDHGGMAIGLDRLIMQLTGTHDIDDVIAFPERLLKQQSSQ